MGKIGLNDRMATNLVDAYHFVDEGVLPPSRGLIFSSPSTGYLDGEYRDKYVAELGALLSADEVDHVALDATLRRIRADVSRPKGDSVLVSTNVRKLIMGVLFAVGLGGAVHVSGLKFDSLGLDDEVGLSDAQLDKNAYLRLQRSLLSTAALLNMIFLAWAGLILARGSLKQARISSLNSDNTVLRWRIAELDNKIADLTAEVQRLLSLEQSLRADLQQASEDFDVLKSEHEARCQDYDKQIADLRLEIDGKLKEIAELSEEVTELSKLKGVVASKDAEIDYLTGLVGRYEGYKDATVLASAMEMAQRMNELVSGFRMEMDGLVADDDIPGMRLMFAINPDLSSRVDSVRTQLSVIVSAWLDDSLPERERAYNESVLAPLLEQFEFVERCFKTGMLKLTFEEVLKLEGKIDFLLSMNDGEEAASEDTYDVDADPNDVWNEFKRDKNLTLEWIAGDGSLVDYFEVLEIEPVDEWSNDFWRKVARPSFIRLSRKYHPDCFEGSDEKFKLINHAKEIFSDPSASKDYLAVYKFYKELFANV